MKKKDQITEDVFYEMFALKDNFFKILSEKCPTVFRREPMIWNWSIDVRQGWYLIVYELSAKIENLVQKYRDEGKFIMPEVYSKRLDKLIPEREELPLVTQVKEKFGQLRYYTMGMPIEAEEWIKEAEELASRTCEVCGIEEDVTTEEVCGWINTLCPKCMRNEREDRKHRLENADDFIDNLFIQIKEINKEIERRSKEDGKE